MTLLGGGAQGASGVADRTGAATSPLNAFRVFASDLDQVQQWELDWAEQRRANKCGPINALAFSCGGANGAFGAGLVVGLSQAGRRPAFDVVTGVSTGALSAPFAFAGPEWDERLRAAYLDPRLGALCQRGLRARIRSGVGALFRSSLAGAGPLARLIHEYADDRLLRAVAAAHGEGRRLLVTTAELDTQRCVIWDLGAIAECGARPDDHGRALRLFRSVLIASVSVPGLLPPRRICWDPDGRGAELHVDGCANAPFFLAPGSMARGDAGGEAPALHLIINGALDPKRRRACRGVVPILLRTLDTMGRAGIRARVTTLELLAERHGVALSCSSIPGDSPSDAFNFAADNLETLFKFGIAEAHRVLAKATPVQPAPARVASRLVA